MTPIDALLAAHGHDLQTAGLLFLAAWALVLAVVGYASHRLTGAR